MKHIILASASPRRKDILAMTGLRFDIVASDYEEDNTLNMPPDRLVEQLSRGKAESVARQHPESIIITADTLASLDGRILGKPSDEADLAGMIGAFSGRSHSVYTGFTIMEGERAVTESVETKVFFRQVSPGELAAYVRTGDGMDKSGGYGVQGIAAMLIEKIEGDFLNVVGLPLCRLSVRLKEFGVDLLV